VTQVTTLTYRPDLQGLRAVGIILVVLAHTGASLFPGGFVGVDVFFVLSGYLITGLLIQEYNGSGSIALLPFMARRLKRLLPALFFMLCIVVVTSLALLSNYEAIQQTSSVMYAATWTSNLFFSLSTIDYFAELKAKDLFLHTWSLGVEEQFYLLWPVLILFVFTLLKKLRIIEIQRSQLLAILGVLFLASFGLSWYWTAKNPLWSFYMMPARIWQFSLGAAAFVWFQGKRPVCGELGGNTVLSPVFGRGLEAIGLGLIFGSAVLIHPNVAYPGFLALIPSFGALLVISAGHHGNAHVTSCVLAHPALVWIGDRSYSWYLWHWPVLMLGFSLGLQHVFAATTALVLLSFLLAMLSYRYVELPLWKGALGNTNPTRIIMLSVFAMLTMIWSAQNYLIATPKSVDAPSVSFASQARSDIPIIYAQGCDASFFNADVRPCIFGETNAQKTVVLLGDSIGAQWFSLLPEIFKPHEWRVIILTKSSCPMVDEDVFLGRIRQTYAVCTAWRNAALDYLASIRPDIVFVGSAATHEFSKTQWVNGSARVLARLTKTASQVFVLPGTPTLSFDGPGCLERNYPATQKSNIGNQICREAVVGKQTGMVARYLEQAVERFPNAKMLNLNDLVCPGGHCSAQNSAGLVVFRDQQHLTDSFVRAQVPIVRERLKVLGVRHLTSEKNRAIR